MVRIKQEWWHVEDKLPSGKKFRHVLDIYTNEQFLKYKINLFFVKLKVKSRYKPHELEFIQINTFEESAFQSNAFQSDAFQVGDYIEINLGNLETHWPSANNNNKNLRHVRLEVEYINIKPLFEKRKKLKIIPWFGYDSTFEINGATQPEFYIMAPLGMKLVNKGKHAKLLLYYKKNKITSKKRLLFEDIYIEKIDGKNAYSFLINAESYTFLKSIKTENILCLKVFYDVSNEAKFGFFPIFPALLLSFGILEYIFDSLRYSEFPDVFIASLTYVIIFISYLTFYITLIKDDYEIPLNKFTIIFTPIFAILLIIPQMIPNLFIHIIYPILHLL
jgi:hypothetical protein